MLRNFILPRQYCSGGVLLHFSVVATLASFLSSDLGLFCLFPWTRKGHMASGLRKISNWGNYPTINSEVTSPSDETQLVSQILGASSVLARGGGRCYGDAGLNGRVISTKQLNQIIEFDRHRGTVICQGGTQLGKILEAIVPQGYFLPVTPGTKFVTVGGAIAADVHGKNHHIAGCFSHHVEWFDLVTGDGVLRRCSPTQNKELFCRTIAAMGLTGVIAKACIRLLPIETSFIRQESIKAVGLTEAMELFHQSRDWTYSVAWIDCLKTGRHRGRSILMRGEHAMRNELPKQDRQLPLQLPRSSRLDLPFHLPSRTLNRWTVKAFNAAYYAKQRSRCHREIIPYDKFFYPLDGIQNWNRMYGRQGFTQYQMALPLESSQQGLEEALGVIHDSGEGSFLAVLKLLGKNNSLSPNSFPIEGFTLAMDFKVSAALAELIQRLDEIVLHYNGRVYLAKDACSSRDVFSYVNNVRDAKFDSMQRQRLFCDRHAA